MGRELRTYAIIRTVKETFEVEAFTKKEALAILNSEGRAPNSITVQSEYVHWMRPPVLPKGYSILELKFEK
jgi:hypothetical protein